MTREEQIIKASQLFYAKHQQKPFMDGALWADRTMLNKACEWLEKNACNYEYSGGTCDSWFSASDLVESFRKYMEEQQ